MMLTISVGKIIVTPFELVVKLDGEARVTLSASSEVITLIGQGANVVACNSGQSKWSIKLDNEQQLRTVAEQLGLEIE